MATMNKFRPFVFTDTDEIGLIIRVNAVNATLPEEFLPETVCVEATFVTRGGCRLLSYYLTHDDGMITLPVVPGDGEVDLRQLEAWLVRHGYRCTSDPMDGLFLYSRA